MKIYFRDQSEYFPDHLDRLKREPKISYILSNLKEKLSSIEIQCQLNPEDINTAFFFAYKIFPKKILTYLTEWESENREMRVGDTIVQQATIPPIKSFSQKIIFGVRINNIIREENRVGFSYETLKGHVETGISTFTIEKDLFHKIAFKIHTFSKPGNILARLAGPFFSLPHQNYCTKQALLHVKSQLENGR